MLPRSKNVKFKFKVGDKFHLWFLESYSWIDIISYKNGGNGTLEELKNTLYPQMLLQDFEVVDVKLFKVKLKHWKDFHLVELWYSKKEVNAWLKNNYSKDSLWLSIYNEELKK